MNLVRLCFVLILMLIQSVLKISSENILLQGRYNFNHPPNVDDYNPLRVIINYSDEVSADGRALPNINRFSSDTELIFKPAEELLPPAPPKQNDAAKDIIKEQTDTNFKPEGRALNEPQIPVAVIYEKEENKDALSVKPKVAESSQDIRKGLHRQQKQLSLKESEVYNQEQADNGVQTISGAAKSGKQRVHGEPDPVVPILESENFLFAYRGDYRYGYESGDGTKAFSRGELKTFSDNSTGESVEGSFSYKDKEGKSYSLTYTADENGYRPVGDHLPTPPPLPPAIARALQYLATKSTPESATENYKV